MQHVGSDQQIVGVGFKALTNRVFFNIEGSVFDCPVTIAKTGFSLGKEPCGYIRIHIIETPFRQFRKDSSGRRAGSGSNFNDPQAFTFR